ncbi:MAG: hypothetical protein NZ610_02915 [Candidatus Bipolaricaulota bacterium]|nr:hypothetical protein [Candidatus Bipolaricaulota bacterium]MCS7274344.1 hypothetical protein [Candidatus Bipolaricaulota bacterium]MDW8110474.1 hypothetical protein [Candidatus Bipolaricaulota bacterium]MDW8329155.1 hypothetical protein [Candidatus Bipolaricaulota bacterium]
MRHIRPVAVILMTLSLGWASGLSQTQTVTITVNQSLYLDCSGSAPITHTVTQSDIQSTQPITVGTWSCNVDALTNYILSADISLNPTSVVNASANDFSETCTSATGNGSPTCGAGGTFGPITLGTGGNTAGSLGADFSGNVRVNLSDWDVPTPPGIVQGTITYSVSDSTP